MAAVDGRRARSREGLARVALAVAGSLVALGLAEVAVRVVVALRPSGFERLTAHRVLVADPARERSLGEILRLSDERRRIYELIPSARFRFLGVEVRTNADGFRGRDHAVPKPARVFRVVGLGDSVMFGWSVEQDRSYMALLEAALNAARRDRVYEVINLAVPGYNTVMEVATLRAKGLRYQPDAVLITFLWNDLDLPNFIRKPEDVLRLDKSFLAEAITGRRIGDDLVDAPRDPVERRFLGDPARVPAEYRDMVGMEAYRAAMRELASLAVSHGFRLLLLSHTMLPQFVRDVCRELAIPWLEIEPIWMEYVRAHGIPDARAAWNVTPTDPHPSRLAHTVIAEALARWLGETVLPPS
jgi:lysophospholipase L1-like esterase